MQIGFGCVMVIDDPCMAGVADCGWATGFGSPFGVAFHPSSGALFVTNFGSNTVCRVPAGGGADPPRAHYLGRKTEGKRGRDIWLWQCFLAFVFFVHAFECLLVCVCVCVCVCECVCVFVCVCVCVCV